MRPLMSVMSPSMLATWRFRAILLAGKKERTRPLETRATETVLRFLGSIGRRSEAELYWKLFRERPPESFALITAEAQALDGAIGSVTEQLHYLGQLGLTPALVLGLFRPEQTQPLTENLVEALTHAGVAATALRAPASGPSAQSAFAENIVRTIGAGTLPVVHFSPAPGRDFGGRMRQVASWTRALGTRKWVILRQRGGLGPRARGRLNIGPGPAVQSHSGGLSVINLRRDFSALVEGGLLSATEVELLNNVRELDKAGHSAPQLAVAIASPLNLLEELFTVKGAGTLLVPGTPITRVESFTDVDAEKLSALFVSAFGRPLREDFFQRAPLHIYLDDDYRGAVVLERSSVAPYLTKFAVDRVAQGDGIGRDLWHAVCADHPAFYWRARGDNPVAPWYATMCDGLQRSADWNVYWRGVAEKWIPEVIRLAHARPRDFGED